MSTAPKNIKDILWRFSGEDYTIIQRCNGRIQLYFSLIGLLVLAILICSFMSALYFTEHLFRNAIADIGVGIVWGYIVTNMYVLLLYTISPTLLPTKKTKRKVGTPISFSMGLRISIVILLAIIIAQPIMVLLLKPQSTALAYDIKFLLANNRSATTITIVVVGIFLLPVYLKYNIRRLGEFYEQKASIKKQIIDDDYRDFKQMYRQILEQNVAQYNQSALARLTPLLTQLRKISNERHEYYLAQIAEEFSSAEPMDKYEYWADPPYRTIRKSANRTAHTEQDLLNIIYAEVD